MGWVPTSQNAGMFVQVSKGLRIEFFVMVKLHNVGLGKRG